MLAHWLSLLHDVGHAALLPLHTYAVEQVTPSSMSSAGQGFPPLQYSETSHTPALARQTAEEGSTVSTGQLGPLPGQYSLASHVPDDARQTTEESRNASDGQVGELPGQNSGRSQTPADGLHSRDASA